MKKTPGRPREQTRLRATHSITGPGGGPLHAHLRHRGRVRPTEGGHGVLPEVPAAPALQQVPGGARAHLGHGHLLAEAAVGEPRDARRD